MSFTIEQRSGMQDNFAIVPSAGYVPTTEEQRYIGKLTKILDLFVADEAVDATSVDPNDGPRIEARHNIRRSAVKQLRADADSFVASALVAEMAVDRALNTQGTYFGEINRINQELFLVSMHMDASGKLATDLRIRVGPMNTLVDKDTVAWKYRLYAAIAETQSVIASICDRMNERAARRWAGSDRLKAEADVLLDTNVRKLAGIAKLGLQGPHIALAELALAAMQSEFFALEAAKIKHTYVRSLGVAALLGIVASCLVTWAIVSFAPPAARSYYVFSVATAGAAAGMWLSFLIRRPSLTFAELGVIESDLLRPGIRLIFVMGLTVTVCLLFWVGAINIEIGSLRTAELRHQDPTVPIAAVALLVGLFCGISERALATAVVGRAEAFAGSVGGSGEKQKGPS